MDNKEDEIDNCGVWPSSSKLEVGTLYFFGRVKNYLQNELCVHNSKYKHFKLKLWAKRNLVNSVVIFFKYFVRILKFNFSFFISS